MEMVWELGINELNEVIARYPWFTPARRARLLLTGENDPSLSLPLGFWPTVPPKPRTREVPVTAAVGTTDGVVKCDGTMNKDALIDRFIAHGGYRIDPAADAREAKVDVDIDPGLVTEELAEIYRSQGLHEEADKIYRALNLTRYAR